MPRARRFRIGVIGDLCRQLMYAPPGRRRRQMDAAERLAEEVEPGQVYPRDFVIYRITGYRPDRAEAPVALVGEALVGDLVTLVEHLSRSLEVAAAGDGRTAIRLEELARRWNVSIKTLQRYRQRGLVCHYVVFDDGVKRLACFEDVGTRFAARHPDWIDRAATFGRVGEPDKERMIRDARQQRQRGRTLAGAARALAPAYGRAPETLRSILRRHDRESAEPIFAEPGPLAGRQRRLIHRAARAGVPIATLCRRFAKSPATIHRAINRRRRDLLSDLDLATPPAGADEPDEPEAAAALRALPDRDALALLDAIHRAAPPDERTEQALVGACNALKARAKRAIEALDEYPASGPLDRIETDLRWASLLKRRLVELGLPAAIGPVEQHLGRTLAAAPSEEIVGLLRLAVAVTAEVVETLDGKRRRLEPAVRSAVARALAARPARRARAATRHRSGAVAMAGLLEGLCPWDRWLALRSGLARHVDALDGPARAAVSRRYGLDGSRPLTLDELAALTGTTRTAAARLLHTAEAALRRSTRSGG